MIRKSQGDPLKPHHTFAYLWLPSSWPFPRVGFLTLAPGRVPYFWIPPWTLFRECWRLTACSGHDVIFVGTAGKCQLPVSRVPSKPLFDCLGGILWPLCPTGLGKLIPMSMEDSIDRTLSVLLRTRPCESKCFWIISVLLVSWSREIVPLIAPFHI